MTRMVSSTRLNGSHTLAASALLIGLSLFGFIPPTWAGQPYEEAGGQVVIEAEHAGVITSPMQVASDLNASNGSFIHIPNGTAAGGDAIYEIAISTPGTYVLWGRVLAPTGVDDSFHVAFDGNPNQAWHVARNTSWIWDQANNTSAVDPAKFDLGIGTHTLTIARREDGTQIDKIILTNNLTYVPNLTGPTESPQSPADPLPNAGDYALDFDGIADYVEITAPADFAMVGNKDAASSISFWGNFRGSSNGIIGAAGSAATNYDYFRLGFNSSSLIFVTFNETTKTSYASTQSVALNQWVHVAFVKSTGQYAFYINGVAAGTGTITQNPVTDQRLVIGARAHSMLDGFANAVLDEVRIYSRALSAAEVATQYNSGQGQYGGPEEGLVAGWHFDEGVGSTTSDYSGNGHAGTLVGLPAWTDGHVLASTGGTTPPPSGPVITITSPENNTIFIAQ